MKRPRRTLRRTVARATAAAAVAAVAGAAAAVGALAVVSGPAVAQTATQEPSQAAELTVAGACAWDPEPRQWLVTWTVDASAPAQLRVVGAEPADHPVDGIPDLAEVAPEQPVTGTQRLPDGATSAALTVRAAGSGDPGEDGDPVTAEVAIPADCDGIPATEAALGTWTVDCSGLTITVDNPADEDVTLTFVPSAGGSYDVAVAAGESATVEFPASRGLSVDIWFQGRSILDPATPIEVSQADLDALTCEDDSGGGGGGLPATGFPIVLAAAGAVSLLSLGTGLYVLARRRRIRFTA